MNKIEFEILMHMKEKQSLDRPAWTSTQSTGMFNAHNHKHTIDRGEFSLKVDYYKNRKVT